MKRCIFLYINLGLRECGGEYNINKWGGDAHLDDARRDEPLV